jgi:hypothetical protein
MRVFNLRVRSLDVDLRNLYWDVEDDGADPYDNYTGEVYRSESSEGPFHLISNPFVGRIDYVDRGVPVGHRFRQLHYKVVFRPRVGGEAIELGPATQEPEPDLTALEIRRQIQLYYREYAGRRCWLYPIRTFGARCPSCWDVTMNQKKRSRCITCYDTSYVGGYLRPIEIFISIDPNPNNNVGAQVGQLQPNSTTAKMGFHPGVKPNDLIVEGENQRWRVLAVVSSEHLRSPVQQQLSLFNIPPRDVEMALPLDLGEALRDIELVPPKGLTNLQDIDAELTESMISVYGIRQP